MKIIDSESQRHRVKTKKEFMVYVKQFEEPYLNESSDSYYDLLNMSFTVYDRNWLNKKIYLPGCKLLRATQEHIDEYYKREEELRKKYNAWLNEALEIKREGQKGVY